MNSGYQFKRSIIFLFSFTSFLYGSITDRPKIGLVLSGGGARGFAHIGVLKMLDSLEIPVDYIAGTSMGGIAGALYAIGYSGRDLQEMAYTTDWLEVFTDKSPRSLQPYFQKVESGRYQIELGIEKMRPVLPTGLIVGQKLSLLFSSLTFSFERVNDFDRLPIPFRCVAVDLHTGREVVLAGGSLAKAMRCTMAIPTIFTPVEWGDSLLIDGGILNNLPVDVVKKMGADIVIAVDVMGPRKERKNIKTILDVMQQSMGILGFDRYRKNKEKTDIFIQPDLDGFTVADFMNEKIEEIIRRGDEAAIASLQDLIHLKVTHKLIRLKNPEWLDMTIPYPRIEEIHIIGLAGLPKQVILRQLHIETGEIFNLALLKDRLDEMMQTGLYEYIHYEIVPLSRESIRLIIKIQEKKEIVIGEVMITGHQKLPEIFVRRMLGLRSGDSLDLEDLNRRVMVMDGLGYFQFIRYDLRPAGEGKVNLRLTLRERPKRRLRVGFRFNDHYNLIVAAGVQTSNFPLPGLRFEHELQFIGCTKFHSKAFYPSRTLNLPVYPYIRFDYKDIPTTVFDENGVGVAEYKDRSVGFELGLGFLAGNFFHTEIGYCHEYMNIKPDIAMADTNIFPSLKDKLRNMRVSLRFDFLDNILLPRRGVLIEGCYEGSYGSLNSSLDYELISFSADIYWTFLDCHTFRLYGFWGRGGSDVPVYKFYNKGRPHAFVGMRYDQLFGNRMSLVRLDYRCEVKKNLFFKIMGNWVFDFEYHGYTSRYQSPCLHGAGLGMVFYTPLGILDAIISRGDRSAAGMSGTQTVGYISLGMKF